MEIPIEFTKDYIEENSSLENQLFSGFLKSGEPYKSIFKNNPWLIPPDTSKPLEWGKGMYWDTTVARKHDYWKDFDLPQPTKDINVMRANILEWGYCLVEDAMSEEQCKRFINRIHEQAKGARLAGINAKSSTGQYLHSLINKGRVFRECIEQNPNSVQAGPLIEQILNETLGYGWICHSFLSNGADPGGYPQGMHMDQGPLLPWVTEEAPALFNTMYIPQDVNEENGGTLLIPGSHKIFMEAGSGGEIGKLPPTINLEAKAGTIMLFDGRVFHGTGVNRTDKQRFVATMSNVKSWMRQQENWVLTVSPEFLKNASPKLLHRMGMQALTYGSTIEGFGMGSAGKYKEASGLIKNFRIALEEGKYIRVGQLSEDSSEEELNQEFTVSKIYKLNKEELEG